MFGPTKLLSIVELFLYCSVIIGDAKLELSKKQLKVFEEQKQIEMNKMTHLKDLGVDLTAYLVSQQRVPDKHYKFDTSLANENIFQAENKRDHQTPIQVHLHE